MTKRLFIAINLPEQIKEELSNLLLNLYEINQNKSIKWVSKENLHLTLHFLGDTAEENIPILNQSLKPIIKKFTTLNFKFSNTINAFPSLNYPKIIFVEIEEKNNHIYQLHEKTSEALKKLNYPIDKKAFRLHLTLGRVKLETKVKIPEWQPEISNFQVNTINLMGSQLTPQGPIYTIISQYNLV